MLHEAICEGRREHLETCRLEVPPVGPQVQGHLCTAQQDIIKIRPTRLHLRHTSLTRRTAQDCKDIGITVTLMTMRSRLHAALIDGLRPVSA